MSANVYQMRCTEVRTRAMANRMESNTVGKRVQYWDRMHRKEKTIKIIIDIAVLILTNVDCVDKKQTKDVGSTQTQKNSD